jgi:UDP-N-acetylmuramoyl-L-alanyl-D-glutamate--2,6-diaminopimelate ligase
MALKHLPNISARELFTGLVDSAVLHELAVTGISIDSRQVKSGDLFIAQAGLNSHGMDYVVDAVRAGAVAVAYDDGDAYAVQRRELLQKQLTAEWVAVPSLQQKVGILASRFYGYPSRQCKLIGITGTDGKTSVTHLLVQALGRLQQPAGSIGTLGYGMSNQLDATSHTTPDAVSLQAMLHELVQQGSQTIVMEVSSHALEQYRVSGCEFDIAVLTNLGSDHLDYHGSLEQYALAKSSLFDFPGVAKRILNVNDTLGRKLAQSHAAESVLTYDSSSRYPSAADIDLIESRMSSRGLGLRVATPVGEIECQTALIGTFNVDNLLACVGVLIALGYEQQQLEYALQDLQPIPGRMQLFQSQTGQAAVVIDFAHTAQALEACLRAVQGTVAGDLYCVFGCGGDRDKSKRSQMGSVAEQLCDHVILTDDNPRGESAERIIKDILQGITKQQQVQVIHDRRKAIATALAAATTSDLVVIAGKGHEQYQIIGDQRLPFSDAQVVRDIRAEGLA